jgi:peptidoglycan hydrolase CwlO-like protein
MKKILVFLLSLIPAIIINAQSYEGSIDYQKKDQKAMIIEFPYSPSVVEDAIIEKMEKLGYKKKESKGFLVYKDAVISDISAEPADYMIKVERKSRKEKDESIVYLLMNKGEENLIARSDALVNSNAKTFLNALAPHVEAFNLEREILGQEAVVAKAEKKLRQLIIDQQDMEKKIKKLQDDIKDNQKDQEDQQKQIENQQQTLEAMRGKRKS